MTKFDIRNSADAEQWILARPSLHRPLVVGTLARAVQNPGEAIKGFHIATGEGGRVLALLVMEARGNKALGWRVIGFEGIANTIEYTEAVCALEHDMRKISHGELHTAETGPMLNGQ
jgi:hypothetical protein